MKVMGIDPSTAKPLGVALVDDKPAVISSGLFAIGEIYDLMRGLKPDLVVVEDQYLSFNYSTSKKLSWCAGEIMGICLVLGIPCEVINVSHWKKVMRCTPRDKKDKMAHVRRCAEIFNKEYEDDVSSAILIATAYLTENSLCGKM